MKQSQFERYKVEVAEDIEAQIGEMGCQPILFIGAGLSKRYFGAPNWDQLLEYLTQQCPLCDKEYAYYKQLLGSAAATGTQLSRQYLDWAWTTGRNEFPAELYGGDSHAQSFLKYKVAEHLRNLQLDSPTFNTQHEAEILLLRDIRPHAIITTNYDTLLEAIFPEYTPIIGQQILRGLSFSVGEIFKIHGCVSDPSSIILTSEDYDFFKKKKKYLSAKLLTYFSEHPLLFAGYAANDPNICSILSDIDEALPLSGGMVPNIYFLEWKPDIKPDDQLVREKLIAIEESRSVRVKAITADNFDWVFRAFRSPETVSKISPRILRALLARSYDLVRHDIPRKTLEANFELLESAVNNRDGLAKLLGLTTMNDASYMTSKYPYSLTELGRHLGSAGWHCAHKLIKQIYAEKGVDIKGSDNAYHCKVKISRSEFHKYSEAALTLLQKVKRREPYDI